MSYRRFPNPAERDEKIRILKQTNPSWSMSKIGSIMDCSKETVREALNPGLKKRRNDERRIYAAKRG